MMRHVSRRPMNRRRAATEPVRRTGLPPELFSRIVQAVPMQAAAERYGLSPNSHGWCCCPFHSEKTPSFKIYPGMGGFYCFGCGAGGDVVSFAEKLFGLSPAAAARRLDADFGLGLFDAPAPDAAEDWQKRRAERLAAEAAAEQARWAVTLVLRGIYALPRPRPGQDRWAARYALELANAEYLE
nr:MAG TPA_asm: DNA primase [Caudoviricetes sp.]